MCRALLAGYSVSIICLPLVSAEPVTSTDSTTNAPIARMPERVVTATRTDEPIENTAASVTVIGSEELSARKVHSIAEALQTVPGLVVSQSGTPGQSTSIFVRGTESNHTLLVVDGRRQTPNLLGGYDFANLSLENVDRIEVVRTPSSALYGGDAIGGVVNVITKTGRGMNRSEYDLSFEGGSFRTFRESAGARGASKGFDYSVEASHQSSEFPRRNNDFDLSSLRTSLGYELDENWYFDLKSSFYDSLAGSPGPVTFFDPRADLRRDVFNISPGVTWTGSDVVTAKGYYSFDYQFQRYKDSFGTDDRQRLPSHEIYLQADAQVYEEWKLTAGATFQDLSISQRNAAGVENIHANQTSVAGFLESQWNPIERFQLINSARYDAYSDYDHAFSWRQGAAVSVPKVETKLHASVSKSFSPPTPGDLYFPMFGNPDLKPENSLGWEFGASQGFLKDRMTVSATYFHNEIDDLIQFVFPLPQNVAEAVTEGVEAGLEFRPFDWLTGRFNYTYLTAIDDTGHQRLLRRPRHQVNGDVRATPCKKLTLSAGFSWFVDREDIDAATFARTDAEDYFLVRAAVSYEFSKHLSVWIRGENLTDSKYEDVSGYPALRMAGYGGLKFTF